MVVPGAVWLGPPRFGWLRIGKVWIFSNASRETKCPIAVRRGKVGLAMAGSGVVRSAPAGYGKPTTMGTEADGLIPRTDQQDDSGNHHAGHDPEQERQDDERITHAARCPG